MPNYRDWKERVEEKSDNATTFRLESRQVDRGERWCAQRIAVMDETGDIDDLVLAIRRVGYDHVFDYSDSEKEAEWFINKDPIYLMVGERIVAIFSGADVNDKCKMHITGYKEKL